MKIDLTTCYLYTIRTIGEGALDKHPRYSLRKEDQRPVVVYPSIFSGSVHCIYLDLTRTAERDLPIQ